MKNTLYSRLAALVLAALVSTSLFAAIDRLALTEASAPTWVCAAVPVRA